MSGPRTTRRETLIGLAALGGLSLPGGRSAAGLALPEESAALRICLPREKDIRLLNVWGYARIAGWTDDLRLAPDLAEAIEVENTRIFTIRLRENHRWSDGAPFTAEDVRYWWEDVANDPALSPSGPPAEMLADGAAPEFTVLDQRTVRFAWGTPNPFFLPALARARPVYIFRPAHYLKQFHARYGDPAMIAARVAAEKVSSWAALHNRLDSLYDADNPDLPTLEPWAVQTRLPAKRIVFTANPHFHRRDTDGTVLPRIRRIEIDIVDPGLIAAKTAAGETDLQARGLGFRDVPALKRAETRAGYRLHLWPIAKAAQIALYPNLTVRDPVWRAALRDRRVRIALSLGIDRTDVNQSLYLGLARAGACTMLKESPLFDARRVTQNAVYDPGTANALLDAAGFPRGGNGVRLLPDGRPFELIVEGSGENAEEADALMLIAEHWARIGVRLIQRVSDRAVLRNRAYAGETVMAVWSGWNNGIATAEMPPDELAPVAQDNFSWPAWGQHFETRGAAGEPPDLAEGAELMALFDAWSRAADGAARAAAWTAMLDIHAREQFVIGVISAAQQPVVVSNRLSGVPASGLYGWDPGAQFGIHRPDRFALGPVEEADAGPPFVGAAQN